MEVRRVDLATWAIRTLPKFTTGVQYHCHQCFWADLRSRYSNHPSPPSGISKLLYMGFRTRLYQFAPVWNDFCDDQWYTGMDGAYVFPYICLTVEEKRRKNLNQENWSDRGTNPGPLGERQRCNPSTRAVVSRLVLASTQPPIKGIVNLPLGIKAAECKISYPNSYKFLSTPAVQWLSYSLLHPRFSGSIPTGVDGFFQSVKSWVLLPSEGK